MRRLVLRWSPRVLVVVLWLPGFGARADLIDPAEAACGEAGQACTVDGQPGACVEQTCSRLDYSTMEPGKGPGTMEYACVRCEIGAKVAEPAPAPSPAGGEPVKEPTPTPASEPGPAATAKGTRCDVGPSGSTMSIALGLGLLGLALRRRA